MDKLLEYLMYYLIGGVFAGDIELIFILQSTNYCISCVPDSLLP